MTDQPPELIRRLVQLGLPQAAVQEAMALIEQRIRFERAELVLHLARHPSHPNKIAVRVQMMADVIKTAGSNVDLTNLMRTTGLSKARVSEARTDAKKFLYERSTNPFAVKPLAGLKS